MPCARSNECRGVVRTSPRHFLIHAIYPEKRVCLKIRRLNRMNRALYTQQIDKTIARRSKLCIPVYSLPFVDHAFVLPSYFLPSFLPSKTVVVVVSLHRCRPRRRPGGGEFVASLVTHKSQVEKTVPDPVIKRHEACITVNPPAVCRTWTVASRD